MIIILGRILQIQEAAEVGQIVEDELKQISSYLLDQLKSTAPFYERQVALVDICFLPARTEGEIVNLKEMTEQTMEKDIQKACIIALKKAEPLDLAAWESLEKSKISPLKEIQGVINEDLNNQQ